MNRLTYRQSKASVKVRSSRGKNHKASKITGITYGDAILVSSNDSRIRLYSPDLKITLKCKGRAASDAADSRSRESELTYTSLDAARTGRDRERGRLCVHCETQPLNALTAVEHAVDTECSRNQLRMVSSRFSMRCSRFERAVCNLCDSARSYHDLRSRK